MADKVDKYDNGHRCYECVHCVARVCNGRLVVCDCPSLNNPRPDKPYSLVPAERHGCMQFWEQEERRRSTPLNNAVWEKRILKDNSRFSFLEWDGMAISAENPQWVEAFNRNNKRKGNDNE